MKAYSIKEWKNGWLLLLGLFIASSCSDLDVTALGQLSDSNFPQTEEDAVALANAVYYPNVRISTALGYVFDLTTELEANAEQENSGGDLLGRMKWDPSNSYVATVWQNLYEIVTRANDVVDKVGEATDLRRRLSGEARFLRAYAYFYLVQGWGEVPLVLHNAEAADALREDVEVVYGQIVEDLEYAASVLPAAAEYGNTDKGRATKGAALAYLAKVYLVWGQTSKNTGAAKERYTKSVEYANQVTGYALEEVFLDNWNNNNRNGKEAIFSVQHLQGQYAAGDGGNHLAHCAFVGGFSNNSLPHVYATSDKWYEDFDDADQRKRGTYLKEYTFSEDQGSFKAGETFTFDRVRYRKYIDTTQVAGGYAANTRDINRTVIRYAEVLLLKAEAINERDGGPNAEAYTAINQVRRRAFRQPLNTPSALADLSAGLDYAGFKAAIQQERVFELTYEQNRWTDLVRWRIFVKTVKEAVTNGWIESKYEKQNVKQHYYRFPIPKAQRDINPELWQNYGYDGYDESKTGANPYAGFE
ncbi:MAG: RagB/SusD family nutrient uptake outer membrane protein [Mediterranea sp.]|jgi:hypothetical protein|nr:RagB/SusD family nutrient uptake outer membrane protein [Mediterranea sp.]